MRSGTFRRRGGRAALWLVVGLLVGGLVGAGATYLVKRGKAGIPGGPRLGPADEMDLVPGNAAGFVHVRLRGIWNTEDFAEVRKVVERAGPQALAALDESFVPAPSSIDRMTVVFLKTADTPKGGFQPPPPNGGFRPPGALGELGNFLPPVPVEGMSAVVILAFKEPYKEEQVRANHLPTGVKKSHANKDYWADTDLAAYYPSDTVMVLGDPAGMTAYLTKLAQGTGPLTGATAHARDGGRHLVAALNVGQFGIEPKMFDKMAAGAPAEYKAAVKDAQTVLKMECLSVGLAVTDETKIDVRARYKDDAAATDAEAALRDLAKFARTKLNEQSFKKDMQASIEGKPGQAKPRPIKELPDAVVALLGLGGLNSLDDWLADPPLSRDGSEVVLTPKMPSLTAAYAGMTAASIGMLLPATQKVRVAAGRAKDQNNLKEIGIGLLTNERGYNGFLFPAWKIEPGVGYQPGGLSWRVPLLAFIGHGDLFKQFKTDEPWDSEHNKKLIDKMPAIYASPLAADPPGQTRYKAFVGPGAAFERGKQFRVPRDFPDGLSNTILIVGGGAPVVWTKPDDIDFNGTSVPRSALALPGYTGCNVCMADGSVRWVDLGRVSPATLTEAVTRASGNPLGADW